MTARPTARKSRAYDRLLPPPSCRWVKDPEVPGGRFLVPGCWNRAVYGDHADCQCEYPADDETAPRCPCCGQIVRDE